MTPAPTNPEQVCPTCGGDGFFAITSTERDCPTCHGTGKVAAKPTSYTQNPSVQTGDTQMSPAKDVSTLPDKTAESDETSKQTASSDVSAAKPENRLGECAVHEDEHYKNDDCRGFQLFDADGNYARPASAPADPPDELEQRIRQMIDWYDCSSPKGLDSLAGQTTIAEFKALIASERKAAARELMEPWAHLADMPETHGPVTVELKAIMARLATFDTLAGEETSK